MRTFFITSCLLLERQIPQYLRELIPNWLTFFRVVSVAPIFTLYLLIHFSDLAFDGALFIVTAWFALAAIADYFDGMLARRWKVVSETGARWDPVADKALNGPLVGALIATGAVWHYAWIPAAIIIIREPAVDLLRRKRRDLSFPSTPAAKWKTTLQFVAIGLLMVHGEPILGELGVVVWTAGILVLWASAGLTLLTGLDYFGRAYGSIDRFCRPLLLASGIRRA